MNRVYIILIIFSLNANLKAQDTSYHFISVGSGYFADPDLAGLRGEFNLNYAYSNRLLFFKLQTGIAPFTNFGNATRIYPTIGISTKTNKKISWHIGVGRGLVFCSAHYTPNNVPISYYSSSFIANTGFLINPFHSKKILFGLDASIGRYVITYDYNSSNTAGPHTNSLLEPQTGASVHINFSIHYAIRNCDAKMFKFVK